ncbi:MAG: phenylalanine--tRNA ligase subunit beta [Clostridia bacterium]
MKISLKWLKDFVDIKENENVIASKLTSAGFEVEEILHQDEFLGQVFVGQIEKIEKHPNADSLVVCKVNLGSSFVQIITSATNVFEGALVPVSLDGASLANGIKIKPSVLRGVSSDGMFCSGEELGITDAFYEGASTHGILIFKDEFKLGTSVAQALGLDDIIFDINVTANRPDCMSILGIAREVSALFDLPMKPFNDSFTLSTKSEKPLSVNIENKELCSRYIAVVADNIKINESPLWVKARLLASGINPVNNIVDITNYVLIECGQPMHAFDYEKIIGNQIIIRNAKNNEKLLTLDKKEHVLTDEMLVIANEKEAMVVAGIIGGVDSGISESTKTIVFESAVFERRSIRLTSRKIGVRTDSSVRFEKGVDIGSAEIGMNRALNLLTHFGAGEIASPVIDKVNGFVGNKKVVGSILSIEKTLGIKVEAKKLEQIMNSLGIETKVDGDKVLCEVPSFRSDIENSADIAEEFIRLFGYSVYDSIEPTLLQNATPTKGKQDSMIALQNKIKNLLVDYGFFETINYSICDKKIPEMLLFGKDAPENKVIEILNPISDDIGSIRTTLVGSALSCVRLNQSRGNFSLKLFECGRTYIPSSLPLKELPVESNFLSFTSSNTDEDFYTFKSIIEKVLRMFDVEISLQRGTEVFLHTGISAEYLDVKTGEKLAFWGKVHPTVAKNFDIDSSTYYAQFNLDLLNKLAPRTYVVKNISRFPTIERDLAFVVDEKITVQTLLDSIKKSAGQNFASCELFDIYRSENLGKEKKSLAFKIRFSSMIKTLTDEEINDPMRKILKDAQYKFGAILRS